MTGKPFDRMIPVLMLSVILFFAFGPGAFAQPRNVPDEVKIIVYLIEASNGAPGVDAEIKEIIKELKGELRYSTYKLISKVPKKIKTGKRERIGLPDSRELLLFSGGFDDGRVKLSVKVIEKSKRDGSKEVLNTDFRIVKGGTILIGPYNYREGKLILAISADE
jgi:hypothetical protein